MSSREIDCACGHAQREHAAGVGICRRCGCERPHRKRDLHLEILDLVDAGEPGKRAPTYRVRCPECQRVYETRAFLREIVRRQRCRKCSDGLRLARSLTRRRPRAARPADLPSSASFADRPHGTRLRYIAGCRCAECRGANSGYERLRGKLRREGLGNPIVAATRVRSHLERLSAAGVGRRTVADVAGVAESTLSAIRAGTKTKVRAETARRILDVSADATNDGKLVPAAPTWKRIERLLKEGFTRGAIALRLGMKRAALQLRKDRVTARTEHRVLRLYRELVEGQP